MIKTMWRCIAGSIGFFLPCAGFAQAPLASFSVPQARQAPVTLHVAYDAYARGIPVAKAEAGLSFGPWTYQMKLSYHTIGVIGLFLHGHQLDSVDGSWHGALASPSRFIGEGFWRGTDRYTEIDFQQGRPITRVLVPPNVAEREPVPESLQVNAIDTLSALAELIHVVGETGRCETKVHTFDGRRAIEIDAHTVGEEMLEPTARSRFSGKALHCVFAGRMLAGFKFGDDRERAGKPVRGSAWLAPIQAGGAPIPVRMTFETRWFGDATMYLTGVGSGADIKVADER
jgi:hypothetical protein